MRASGRGTGHIPGSSVETALARQSKYPEEFRRQAVALVLDSGRTIRDVDRKLGGSIVHRSTVGSVNARNCSRIATLPANQK
ncbi:transposase [Micromonospora echinofusca]|uniref:transposase n=1 Tax=Micromonospora echinofusca TaxID=47858 RepID=UPI003400EDB8